MRCTSSKACIRSYQWCNQKYDCEDGSDEEYCCMLQKLCTYTAGVFPRSDRELCICVGVGAQLPVTNRFKH